MSDSSTRRVTVRTLHDMKAAGDRIVTLTVYDASFARLLEDAGVDVLLVGDSLGNVVQGRDSTLGVTLDDMVYHGACVARAGHRALRVIDMPFMSYRSVDQALYSAGRLMAEGGAHIVKLEGGDILLDVVRAFDRSRHSRVRAPRSAAAVGQSDRRLPGAGEGRGRRKTSARRGVPAGAGRGFAAGARMHSGGTGGTGDQGPAYSGHRHRRRGRLRRSGAGAVRHARHHAGKTAEFFQDFLAGSAGVADALSRYVQAVRSGAFPAPEHSFN